MARSQETFNKKEVRSKKEKKRREKAEKRAARKEEEKSGNLEDMMAYVDEFGNITDTPPDPTKKKKEIKAESIEINIPRDTSIVDADPIRTGTVTFFNDSKGYGFIKDSETSESVFVHANNCIDEINDNNLVTFEVEMGPKGPTAVKVTLKK